MKKSKNNQIYKRGFTETEAAVYLGLSRSFLRQARSNGARKNHSISPPWIQIGRSIRYLKEDLDTYLDRLPKNGQVKAAIDDVIGEKK